MMSATWGTNSNLNEISLFRRMEAHLLFFSDAEASMQKRILLGFFFLFGLWAGPRLANGQTFYTSNATGSPTAPDPTGVDHSPSWPCPVAKLDEALPSSIR